MAIDKQYLDDLQELIGQWHDLDATLCFLLQKGLKGAPVYTVLMAGKQTAYEEIRKRAKSLNKKIR